MTTTTEQPRSTAAARPTTPTTTSPSSRAGAAVLPERPDVILQTLETDCHGDPVKCACGYCGAEVLMSSNPPQRQTEHGRYVYCDGGCLRRDVKAEREFYEEREALAAGRVTNPFE